MACDPGCREDLCSTSGWLPAGGILAFVDLGPRPDDSTVDDPGPFQLDEQPLVCVIAVGRPFPNYMGVRQKTKASVEWHDMNTWEGYVRLHWSRTKSGQLFVCGPVETDASRGRPFAEFSELCFGVTSERSPQGSGHSHGPPARAQLAVWSATVGARLAACGQAEQEMRLVQARLCPSNLL